MSSDPHQDAIERAAEHDAMYPDLVQHWEQQARRYARDKRDLQSNIFAAIKELEKLGNQERIINILKGDMQ